jgi:signal transduction histidine kinase
MGDIRRLEEPAGGLASLQAIRWSMEQYQNCGALQSDFRCLKVDRKIWSPSGLAEDLRRAGSPPPPRFKSEDEILVDAHRVVDGYLAQIERGLPALARSAMLGLMSELTALCRLRNEDVHESWLIRPLAEKVSAHIRERHQLYTEKAKVFRKDEWATLTVVLQEDDEQLDRRYEEWVEKTQSMMREMSAEGRRLKEIRRMVKQRLIDDLILRMMELEMTYRSLLRGLPLPDLFPRHHDAKNRVAYLTTNIDHKTYRKESFVIQTKTLQGWIRGRVLGMVRKAREAGGKVTFFHAMDAGLPVIELNDLTETERHSIDDILTELMANAVKYRRPGVPLDVRVHMTEGDGTIEFRVLDNGMGIQDIGAVLEDGLREHPDMADGYGGGLVSVMRHVQSHGGWSLAVQSEPGQGSAFILLASLRNKNAQHQRLTESGFPKV